jgi:hypothetical protein
MRTVYIAIAIALALGIPTAAAHADDPYDHLPASPYDVYHATLRFAEDGNFAALDRSLKHMRPLLRFFGQQCGMDLEGDLKDAIAHRNGGQAARVIVIAIWADLRRHLQAAVPAGAASVKRDEIHMAFALYRLGAPEVSQRDQALDGRVRERFRELYRTDRVDDARRRVNMLVEILTPALPRCEKPAR